MNALLQVEDLSISYTRTGRPAVRDVSFSLEQGESLALVGETGSGKTSIVLAITRLLAPTAQIAAGTLRFDDQDVLGLDRKALRSVRRDSIGMVFQDPFGSWNPARTIGAQLLDGVHGARRKQQQARLIDFMTRIGISDAERRLRDYPHQYSGGMLQRTLMAGALLRRPRLVVADEPTSALDSTVQADILALIDQLRREQELALLLVSHDLGVVARVAARTIVLYHGVIVEQAPTAALLEHPRHPYTANLIAAIPHLYGPRHRRLGITAPAAVPSETGCVYAHRCALASDLCREQEPEIRTVGDSRVACHHAESTATLLGAAS